MRVEYFSSSIIWCWFWRQIDQFLLPGNHHPQYLSPLLINQKGYQCRMPYLLAVLICVTSSKQTTQCALTLFTHVCHCVYHRAKYLEGSVSWMPEVLLEYFFSKLVRVFDINLAFFQQGGEVFVLSPYCIALSNMEAYIMYIHHIF